MPYRRNYRRRRRRYKRRYVRRPRQNKWQKYGNLAYSGYKLARTAISLLNVELKCYDQTHNATLADTWQSYQLTTPILGDDDDQRQGQKIRLKTVSIKTNITLNTSNSHDIVRVCLVKQPLPDSSKNIDTDCFDGNTIMSNQNMDNTKRYKVIYSKTFTLSTVLPERVDNKFLKLDVPLHFNGNSQYDQENNQYFLMYICKSTSSYKSNIEFTLRSRYIDN
jgi:hypothetical protein